MTGRRLSICYAAPGQNLVPWAGPTRNVLSVAEALSERADVTVAFRRVPRAVGPTHGYRVLAIEPGTSDTSALADDNATRGLHPFRHLSYCRTVWSFARQQSGRFDVVLEKGWRLSGLASLAFRRAGVPGIVVENDVRRWTEPIGDPRQLGKYVLHELADAVAGACSRRAARVIAETDELKDLLVANRGVEPHRIEVVRLGVDHALFRPGDQTLARRDLGIRPDATMMLYVGAMDEYHDLEPVIHALGRSSARVDLHVVGDGEYRERCETSAQAASIACRFHGSVPHALVPRYIAAADVCIAPYRTEAFHGGRMSFSTLKIPEYMACGRAVVSVPCTSVRRLVADGVTGFLVSNDEASWRSFLDTMPSRQQLASMGAAAAKAVQSVTWGETAARYLETCESVISSRAGFRAAFARPAGLSR